MNCSNFISGFVLGIEGPPTSAGKVSLVTLIHLTSAPPALIPTKTFKNVIGYEASILPTQWGTFGSP